MQNVMDQFTDETIDAAKIQQMAEFIAIEDDAISTLDRQVKDRKENLKQVKADLATMMMQAGIQSPKLDCGLTPRYAIETKYFKAQGVEDETLFSWLKEKNLDGVIKPTVPWNTLNKTIADYVDQWGDLPDIFQKTDTPTITMYGKSKYIANRKAESPAAL